jgi:hypothetical protein
MIVRSLPLGVDAPIFGRPSCGNSKKESPAQAAGLKAITMKSKYPDAATRPDYGGLVSSFSSTSIFVEVGLFAWSR